MATKQPAQKRTPEQMLEAKMKELQKKYGATTVMNMSETPDLEWVPTGSPSLDYALGGGVPKGKVIEIHGASSGGKSTIALTIARQFQKELPGMTLYIDLERTTTKEYAESIGLDTSRMLLASPVTGEDAIDVMEELLSTGGVSLIVLDSLAALLPKEEEAGKIGDAHVALQARLINRMLQRVIPKLDETGATLILINQIRQNIGSFGFGDKYKATGGKSIEFYAHLRLKTVAVGKLKRGDDWIGNKLKVTTTKSKSGRALRTADLEVIFGEGISLEGDVINWGEKEKVLRKSGAYYYYGEESIGQGKEAARQYLIKHPELRDEIFSKVMEKIREEEGDGLALPITEDEQNELTGGEEYEESTDGQQVAEPAF